MTGVTTVLRGVTELFEDWVFCLGLEETVYRQTPVPTKNPTRAYIPELIGAKIRRHIFLDLGNRAKQIS
jgi:hypothetical protein